MYRILDSLRWGNGRRLKAGTLDPLKGVSSKVRAILEARGAISRIVAPPLRIMPGWKERAEKLEQAGVEDVNDLLDADLRVLSEELDTPVEDLEQSVEEALQYVR